jgi:hypothetical protein
MTQVQSAVFEEQVTAEAALDALIVEAKKIADMPVPRFRHSVRTAAALNSLAPLTPDELLSVQNVLAYVAHNHNIEQDQIKAVLEAEFSANHIDEIPRRDFQHAIEFLINLRMDEMRSRK